MRRNISRIGVAAILVMAMIGGFADRAHGQDEERPGEPKHEEFYDEPFTPRPVDPRPDEVEDPTDHREYARAYGV